MKKGSASATGSMAILSIKKNGCTCVNCGFLLTSLIWRTTSVCFWSVTVYEMFDTCPANQERNVASSGLVKIPLLLQNSITGILIHQRSFKEFNNFKKLSNDCTIAIEVECCGIHQRKCCWIVYPLSKMQRCKIVRLPELKQHSVQERSFQSFFLRS